MFSFVMSIIALTYRPEKSSSSNTIRHLRIAAAGNTD